MRLHKTLKEYDEIDELYNKAIKILDDSNKGDQMSEIRFVEKKRADLRACYFICLISPQQDSETLEQIIIELKKGLEISPMEYSLCEDIAECYL